MTKTAGTPAKAMTDSPLNLHPSIRKSVGAFRYILAATTWLAKSVAEAKKFHEPYPYICTLACSAAPGKDVKIDKTILDLTEEEDLDRGRTPLLTRALTESFRIFTIAVKEIIWGDPSFRSLKNHSNLEFLKHIRNASAHGNSFYWGTGRSRSRTISRLPVSWRGKTIKASLEGSGLYFDFLSPGDLFLLLEDISGLVPATAAQSSQPSPES